MDFVHKPYIPGQTIAAIATPIGEGGVAIIRISGNEAITVANRVFSKNVTNLASHTVHFGKVVDEQGATVDDVLLLVMRAPRSFTGEDTVEIHCHGGSFITKKVLECVIKAGALPASPGEFSFKAYINGKIDLAQAEAIQRLIGAKNERALLCAKEQLAGKLSEEVSDLQKNLTRIAAILEAWVDFPEEDLEFAPFEEVIRDMIHAKERMQKLIATYDQGKKIHEGLHVCLVGSPNVGKSSLLNFLLGKERAIVSDIAGTTRDIVEDTLLIKSLHVRITDTAGVRQTQEVIEEEGIRRTKKAAEQADIILLVGDSSEPELFEWDFVHVLSKENTILVWNKIDLVHEKNLPSYGFKHVVHISCHTKQGIEALAHTIEEVAGLQETSSSEQIVLTSMRHKDALSRAVFFIDRVIEGLKNGESSEFVAYDMREVLIELGTIRGVNINEEILNSVFSQFCIGK